MESESVKIYVGNLPFSVNEDQLKELFGSYGKLVQAEVIKDKFSGRSKGFGFITFETREDAEKAISEMNEKDVDGRAIKVSEAKPMDPDRKPQRRSFGGGGYGGRSGGSGGFRREGRRDRF